MSTLSKEELVELIMTSLDDMMAASEEMWVEKDHCNYKEYAIIKETRYNAARNNMMHYLLELIDKY